MVFAFACSASTTAGGGLGLSLFGGSGLLIVILNLGGGDNSSLLLVSCGHNVCGDAKGLGEERDTGVGDGAVAPLPGEDVNEVAVGLKALDNHLDLEVTHTFNVVVLGEVAVLLDDDDSLLEDVRMDRSLFFLAYEYHDSPNVIQ